MAHMQKLVNSQPTVNQDVKQCWSSIDGDVDECWQIVDQE